MQIEEEEHGGSNAKTQKSYFNNADHLTTRETGEKEGARWGGGVVGVGAASIKYEIETER